MAFHIVIVGGGIAGFTAAIALRAPNRIITVLEQSRLNKEIGALISLQPNASRIVESEWGLRNELHGEAKAIVDEGFRIYNTEGHLVNSLPLKTRTEYGADRLCFHRRDLHDTLKKAAVSPDRVGDPVVVRTACKVTDCDPLKGSVTLEDGETITGDLIIGADGIHSVVRKHVLFDTESSALPTGLSAYRLMISTDTLEKEEPEFCSKINPRDPFTSMIVAHNCRLVMGPGREGQVYGIVALVPDEQMNEDPNAKQSWVAEGDLAKMLETFSEFPTWVTKIFKHSPDLGLWQLRDLDPLGKWHHGRVILIGDAAHAMLPTQGQGASQAIEDAEALGSFFRDICDPPPFEDLSQIFQNIFEARYSRASLIQTYSREAAKPATAKDDSRKVTMRPDEFMDYNCMYRARHLDSRGYSIREKQEASSLIVGQIEMSESISVRRVIVDSIDATPSSAHSTFGGASGSASFSANGDIYETSLTSQADLSLDSFIPSREMDTLSNLNSFPAFFEQVMLPSLIQTNSTQETQQPRVFDFMQDTDFTLAEHDIFGTDFIPDLDRIFDPTMPFPGFESSQQPLLDDQDSARRRAAAFQRSLWLWVPEKNQHAFSDERRIPLRDSDSIPEKHQDRLQLLKIPGRLSSLARDDIFKLVICIGGSRLSVAAFPSADYLDTLIKVGIGKRTETDAWIHPYTFYDTAYHQLRPELLTALVAAGCVCCGLPSISKTGIILQEITRVGLAQLVEDDNSVLRDLQYLQASMLWLDIGIFCGYTRKMQIAESYLQPLCTALRRASTFDRSNYSTITPFSFGDDESSLQRAWYSWVRQESFKRLVYHLFGHDVEVATSMNRPALTSYAELTLPFPAARELWLAPTASVWKDTWTSRYTMTTCSDLSLRDLLSDPSFINQIPPELDLEVARTALLHGLAVQTYEFRHQMLLSQGCQSGSKATTRLWLQSRQEDLYTTLISVQKATSNPPAVTTLLNEFTLMYLHIDIDGIQRFVGKLGEHDARRAYPALRDWSQTKEARTAIWHAGQVLRAARNVAAYQFRGFDSLSIYHAALVLWVYGLLHCGENRRTEVHTPLSEADLAPIIALDGLEDQTTKAFLARGIGRPGLTMYDVRGTNDWDDKVTVFCELGKPRSVMAVAKQIFENNCPLLLPDDVYPPMIQNLCALIEDLGNLP
ncbi:uncharacterized protein N7469_005000 [Penicillium citrinum]|uniref:Transcription factor domain-containing protein n=1 Tax=Penicillium citrinum TaxID=5077 RepID=A0A9W9P0Q3_PENCI|nr:uncharacterized protein N7469_005000 [Penicillium citrinum]KAJ5233234.1 hypothetical protein N7469_005000 [Penicillium citrinum]